MYGDVYAAVAKLLREGRRGALITIVETLGSTPRKAGAKMLVTDRGELIGTVGGGCVEADLVAFAKEVMSHGHPQLHEIDLTAKSKDENDMLCGGKMRAFIEPIVADEKLVIFGGGHISRALHELAARLDFRIIVTDDRVQFANPERFPLAAEIIAEPFERQFEKIAIDASTYIVIATRGHAYDELCMEQSLRTPARYIAMVGSRTKVALFKKSLREKGFSDEQLARVVCPAGLDIGAETPEEIAVSIIAQLISVRRRGSLNAGCFEKAPEANRPSTSSTT
ncbi:MAG: XdhC/CoxI family protein [Candidatus Sumerlaeaceae bacterium]|nr:XdhC/CoxI family protein [Candidatus Sumerlaeaceae bacterium]